MSLDIVEVFQPGVLTVEKQVVSSVEVAGTDTRTVEVNVLTVEVTQSDIKTVEVYNPSIGDAALYGIGGSNLSNAVFDDTTPVGVPTGLSYVAGFNYVRLYWDRPTARNYAHTEVWRHTIDSLNAASLVDTAVGTSSTDSTEPNTLYYYWVRHLNFNGDPGPWASFSGLAVNTTSEASALLQALQGKLDDSLLVADLKTKIDQTTINKANLVQEIIDRGTAVDEVTARTTALETSLTDVNGATNVRIYDLELATTDASTGLGALGARVGGIETSLTSQTGDINARIVTVEEASADPTSGFAALASRSTVLETSVTNFDASKAWHFDSDLDLWTQVECISFVNTGSGTVQFVAATAGAYLQSEPGLTLTGSVSPFVHARVRRNSGVSMDGRLYFINDVDIVYDELKTAQAVLPAGYVNGEWVDLKWDLSGHTSWDGRTITQLRLMLSSAINDDWEIDWVAVGRTGPSNSNAQIEETLETVNGLSAQWAVKVNVDGHVAGVGLASTPADGGGQESEFIVLADSFAILHPNATDPTNPTLAFGVENGKTVMSGASIQTASIDSASIISLEANKITAGTIYSVNLYAATMKTSTTGGRIEVRDSDNSITVYNPWNQIVAQLRSSAGGGGAMKLSGFNFDDIPFVVTHANVLPSAWIKGNAYNDFGVIDCVNEGTSSGKSAASFASGNKGSGYTKALICTGGTTAGGARAFWAERGGYYDNSGQGYLPFTGCHDGIIHKSKNPVPGDILVDTGVFARKGVSDVICFNEPSSYANQKGAVGVYKTRSTFTDSYVLASLSEPETVIGTNGESQEKSINNVAKVTSVKHSHDIVVLNSVGEGQINVCGQNGNIEIGDLIVTSDTAGKGMKQADDIVRGYTVAKAREAITFTAPTEVKQVACIYVCG